MPSPTALEALVPSIRVGTRFLTAMSRSRIVSRPFGIVHKGRDTILERDIAVKVLNRLATEFTEAEQERFRREARILAALSHPNVPAIYDLALSKSEFLIIFEFVDGQTLKAIIEKE